ncbi:MAG: hypothetical protein PHE03_11395, partial [Bacteroidales bacterium]|nr:hypothetical protein [Bacteroidales bacterium]
FTIIMSALRAFCRNQSQGWQLNDKKPTYAISPIKNNYSKIETYSNPVSFKIQTIIMSALRAFCRNQFQSWQLNDKKRTNAISTIKNNYSKIETYSNPKEG